ncbi:hypothetical protein ACFT5B_08865 [Luteimicrobium sp. NPDC057192]|uniref:hypothetical protein n=1 Tax=Luteimicrobium sp. NPDC057192 TaxID=3346042 RepID=UPI003626A44A
MFELSPAEAVVVVAWLVGIGCAVARVRAAGPRLTSLGVLALAVVVPVVGSLLAMAAFVRRSRTMDATST